MQLLVIILDGIIVYKFIWALLMTQQVRQELTIEKEQLLLEKVNHLALFVSNIDFYLSLGILAFLTYVGSLVMNLSAHLNIAYSVLFDNFYDFTNW